MFNASMNFNLGEEIDAIRETVQRFAAEEIAPRAQEIDQTNNDQISEFNNEVVASVKRQQSLEKIYIFGRKKW